MNENQWEAQKKEWGIEPQGEQEFSRCPHIIRKLAGDETYDLCNLDDKPCLVEHGHYECEIWDEIQKKSQ